MTHRGSKTSSTEKKRSIVCVLNQAEISRFPNFINESGNAIFLISK